MPNTAQLGSSRHGAVPPSSGSRDLNRTATVKHEDGPLVEPPAVLDLPSPEVVYSGDGTLCNSLKISNSQ